MRRWAIDLILLLTILVGGALAWTSGRERSRLAAEYARLARHTGDLPLGDPGQVHLVALDTGEPLHFAWRVYFPANYQVNLTSGDGAQSSSSATDPTEAIIRLRFRDGDQGVLEVYVKGSGGSSRHGMGDKALADLLRGRWGEIEVEQMGSKEVAVIKPDEQVSLIKLTLPERMREEAKRTLSEWTRGRFVPTLYELKLGRKKP